MESKNEKLKLKLDDLDLVELEAMTQEATYALPEVGATMGWNSCSRAADDEISAN